MAPKKECYEKPVLRRIELKADEVLIAGCKTDHIGFAPMGSPCTAMGCGGSGS